MSLAFRLAFNLAFRLAFAFAFVFASPPLAPGRHVSSGESFFPEGGTSVLAHTFTWSSG